MERSASADATAESAADAEEKLAAAEPSRRPSVVAAAKPHQRLSVAGRRQGRRLVCDHCSSCFGTVGEALAHATEQGLLHRFVACEEPIPGDHLYTASYKDMVSSVAGAPVSSTCDTAELAEAEAARGSADAPDAPCTSGIACAEGGGSGTDARTASSASSASESDEALQEQATPAAEAPPEGEPKSLLSLVSLETARRFAVDAISLPEHHGIYVGRGLVVTFDGCDRGFLLAGESKVALIPLSEFAGGKRLFIGIHDWRFSANETMIRALWAVGKTGYNVQLFTCEHLATWCCTNVGSSTQSWYSGFYADPMFPLGWVAAVAKDVGRSALQRLQEAELTCICGALAVLESVEVEASTTAEEPLQTLSVSLPVGSQSGAVAFICGAGHVLCADCLRRRQTFATAEYAATADGSAFWISEGGGGSPGNENECAAQAVDETKSEKVEEVPRIFRELTRPLCCPRASCWETLVDRVRLKKLVAPAADKGQSSQAATPPPQWRKKPFGRRVSAEGDQTSSVCKERPRLSVPRRSASLAVDRSAKADPLNIPDPKSVMFRRRTTSNLVRSSNEAVVCRSEVHGGPMLACRCGGREISTPELVASQLEAAAGFL